MKSFLAAFMIVILSFGVAAAAGSDGLKDGKEQESYSLGYQIGDNIKRQGADIQLEILTRGIRDALDSRTPALSPKEMQDHLAEMRHRIRQEQQKIFKEKSEKNLAAAKAFLEENKKKEGVLTLRSGLQYRVITQGSGAVPKLEDNVSVHYRGTLINGSEFDSSYSRNAPQVFAVDSVIPGWTEALLLMKTGSKWQLFIPPDLAYGPSGMGAKIEPNSLLIFELELLSVEEAPPEEVTVEELPDELDEEASKPK